MKTGFFVVVLGVLVFVGSIFAGSKYDENVKPAVYKVDRSLGVVGNEGEVAGGSKQSVGHSKTNRVIHLYFNPSSGTNTQDTTIVIHGQGNVNVTGSQSFSR